MKFNLARPIFIGVALLGYPERDVWRMTLRKLMLLFEEHQKEHGTYRRKATLDDLIPL